MRSFLEFKVFEEDSTKTSIQKIEAEISAKFDEITQAKSLKKENDYNSEIVSVDKQALIYTEISNLMKRLSTEMRKESADRQKAATTQQTSTI